MKKLALASLVMIVALLAISLTVQATPFQNPPETNAPAWVIGYPYQRNIMWDFSVNPTIKPTSYNDPNADVHYQGTDDIDSWESDYVEFGEDTEWRDGKIGVWADTDSMAFGVATFHIDNMIEERPFKHVWIEMDIFTNMGGVNWYLGLPEGYNIVDEWSQTSGGFTNIWYRIEPNPPWEELKLTFTAGVPMEGGCYAYIDSLHVATECIPEPGTMILLGSLATGLFGFAGLRKRFKK